MQIQPSSPSHQPDQVRISKRALEQVMRVNPQFGGGRSVGELKHYLERGGAMHFDNKNEGHAPGAFAHSQAEPQSTPQEELEHALGFFIKSQVKEAEATLAELESERRRLEAAMDATRTRAETKIKSFIGMLDPVTVAQFGRGAVAQHEEKLNTLNIKPSTLLNL
ncbi:MAG: hypothetical protein VX834_01980 [Myxococcota bacterium]|nr:hypothetical protein [Myxococcota bacterium]